MTNPTAKGESRATEIFGYAFANPQLLEEALTTPSCKMDHPKIRDNQRLEFLGDAVLGLLAANHLFGVCPRDEEGSLTVKRTHMVSSRALCRAAVPFSLAETLRRNRGSSPIPENSKTIADAIEAVIGAAWLDGGMEAAAQIFDTLKIAANAEDAEWRDNPKGELQVRAQALEPPRRPEYRTVSVTGKSHDPHFTVEVSVRSLGSATACAGSLQDAEFAAARKLLAQLKSREPTKPGRNLL